MIRHQMAGIAQASDGWNQFLSRQGGFGHVTFRPNKHRTKNMMFVKTQRSQKSRNQTKSMTSSFHGCKGSTKCIQLPKHSSTHAHTRMPVSKGVHLTLSVRVLFILFPLCQCLRKLQHTAGTYTRLPTNYL